MTLVAAAAQNIVRMRKAVWANPGDYFKIDIIDGHLGPWGHLYAPCQTLLKLPRPQDVLLIGTDYATDDEWHVYDGPLLEVTT